jgi:hypothetical protein
MELSGMKLTSLLNPYTDNELTINSLLRNQVVASSICRYEVRSGTYFDFLIWQLT